MQYIYQNCMSICTACDSAWMDGACKVSQHKPYHEAGMQIRAQDLWGQTVHWIMRHQFHGKISGWHDIALRPLTCLKSWGYRYLAVAMLCCRWDVTSTLPIKARIQFRDISTPVTFSSCKKLLSAPFSVVVRYAIYGRLVSALFVRPRHPSDLASFKL